MITDICLIIIATCQLARLFIRTTINNTIHSVNVKDPERWLKDLMEKQKFEFGPVTKVNEQVSTCEGEKKR